MHIRVFCDICREEYDPVFAGDPQSAYGCATLICSRGATAEFGSTHDGSRFLIIEVLGVADVTPGMCICDCCVDLRISHGAFRKIEDAFG